MILINTGTFLRQHGIHRIDITAIIMLLIVLTIVLVANLTPPQQPDVVQASVPVQAFPVVNVEPAIPDD